MKILWDIFITFFKIGLFSFGGGYAMIPLIQSETVDNKKWIESDELLEVIAIAESTPGPIAINAATFVGYKVSGLKGALAATIGVSLPSFIIISIIATLLQKFQDLKVIKYAFFGIKAGILALIVKAVYSMFKQMKKNTFSYIIIALSFTLVVLLKTNVIFAIILCGFLGLLYTYKGGQE